jgi:hypothetical protein
MIVAGSVHHNFLKINDMSRCGGLMAGSWRVRASYMPARFFLTIGGRLTGSFERLMVVYFHNPTINWLIIQVIPISEQLRPIAEQCEQLPNNYFLSMYLGSGHRYRWQ